MEPRLAIVTIADDNAWICFVAHAFQQGDLVAGNELSTGEWFQVKAEQCTVTYDPCGVSAWPQT